VKQQPSTPSSKPISWFSRSAWTILDQALFAGSNFLLNVLLARWLSPVEYGAFTVAFTAFLLLGTAHTGLITEPMLVFGSGRFKQNIRSYITVLFKGHLLFSAAGAIILALIGAVLFFTQSKNLGFAFMTLSVAQPFLLLLWLARRECYTVFNVQKSALGGLVYSALMVAGTYALFKFNILSTVTAVTLLSVCSLIVASALLITTDSTDTSSTTKNITAEVLKKHWIYGRWAVCTDILSWMPGQLLFFIVPIWWGLEASAAIKALLNFFMPIAHSYSAIAVMLVPAFVRAREHGGFTKSVTIASAIVLGAAILYAGVLFFFGDWCIGALYKHKYDAYANRLWIVGLIPLAAGVMTILGAGLKALERPDRIFWAQLFSAAIIASLGVYLMRMSGVSGALWGYLISKVFGSMATAYFFLPSRLKKTPRIKS
jgi:O-antigen/teichoic acid export membrane protein